MKVAALVFFLLAAAVTILCAEPPLYEITVPPVYVMESWYDYMIGGYYDLPIAEIPQSQGGGRIMTFHARHNSAPFLRKVYFSYIDESGQIQTIVDPWDGVDINMGFSSMALDKTLWKALYSWHEVHDADTPLEIVLMHESDPLTVPGLYSPRFPVFDPPLVPPGHENDEYLWPSVKTGPSPNPGMRRVYILGRNSYNPGSYPSESVCLAYADYNTDMLDNAQPLNWSYTSIPLLDDWANNTEPIWRRMYGAFAVGDDGNVYYAGWHFTHDTVYDVEIVEPELDVFVCGNYGEGAWQHHTHYSKVPSYNPWNLWSMTYAFYYLDGPAVPDEDIYYHIGGSTHFNLVIDAEGKLHYPGLWSLRIGAPGEEIWMPHTADTVKEVVFDPVTAEFEIREIFPVAGSSSDNLWWMPWDQNGDGGADYWDWTQPLPEMTFHFPYCHWDHEEQTGMMYFHYNYVKMTEDDASGAMACVWQDSHKARCFNISPDQYPEYAAFAEAPEIMIALSNDRGQNWQDPVRLSSVTNPELADMTPMWVNPGDVLTYVPSPGRDIYKRLYLMFLDDHNWGACLPPSHAIDWGNVMYMALDIDLPVEVSDPSQVPRPDISLDSVNPNPFASQACISFRLEHDARIELSVYNLKGQRIRNLASGYRSKGENEAVWDGRDENGTLCASGIYLLYLNSKGSCSGLRKITLIRHK